MQINDGQCQKQVGVFRIVHDGILVFLTRLVVAILTQQQAGQSRMWQYGYESRLIVSR